MGQNASRYQAGYDLARAARHRDEVMLRGGQPQSLSESEREHGLVAITTAPRQVAVSAWVRYETTPILVDAWTSRWTSRAVEVSWVTPKGETHRAWVWANAVRRRQLTTEERLGVRRPSR